MQKIAILADSGCQITIGHYEQQGIFIVPLCITMKEETYRDQIDINSIEVFETMEKEDLIVQTSQPSTGELLKIIQKIKEQGYDHIIGLPIATGLSSTLSGMKTVADMVGIPISLVDTRGTAGTHKYLVQIAYELVQEGKECFEIVDILKDMVNHSGTIIMAPNLNHLKKGGRITPAVALLAGMLKIVPVMELNDRLGGRIDSLAKVRTLKKAREVMVDRMIEKGVNAQDYIVTIEHVLCLDSAKEIQQIILDKIGQVEMVLRELPSVVGAHMGVGGLGIQYIRKYKKMSLKI